MSALGQPSTVRQIADQLALVTGVALTTHALKRRLDQLVEAGKIFPTRSKGAGRPYVYALAGVPAELHGDARDCIGAGIRYGIKVIAPTTLPDR